MIPRTPQVSLLRMNATPVIAFLGGGNMAASLIGGWLAEGHPAASVRVAELDAARRDELDRSHGVAVFADAAQAVAGAQALVLAVKPQQMESALRGLELPDGCTVISIAAGIPLSALRDWLGPAPDLIRCMPNTPALLRAGITGLYAPPQTSAAARALAEQLLRAAGTCVWVDEESQLDTVTAVSGSGPAYFFLLTELLADAGAALGLPADVAATLARQTLIGAARMAQQEADVAALRARVTSKGGTTAAALDRFATEQLPRIVHAAVGDAARRSAELGQHYGTTHR